jgi:hypothetical protein
MPTGHLKLRGQKSYDNCNRGISGDKFFDRQAIENVASLVVLVRYVVFF